MLMLTRRFGNPVTVERFKARTTEILILVPRVEGRRVWGACRCLILCRNMQIWTSFQKLQAIVYDDRSIDALGLLEKQPGFLIPMQTRPFWRLSLRRFVVPLPPPTRDRGQ